MRWNIAVQAKAAAMSGLLSMAVYAEDGTRRGWNEKLQDARVKAQQTGTEEGGTPPTGLPPQPKPGTPPKAPKPDAATVRPTEGFVGFTLWLHRNSEPADPPVVRAIVNGDDGQPSEWTPIRAAAGHQLKPGERFSMSVETSRSGYLYIVDQEVYRDGSRGTPYLIFPTAKLLKGNNRVTAGRVIMIPASDDDPPFYRLKAERADLAMEELTVFVSTERIEGFQTGASRQVLSKAAFEQVQRTWLSKVEGPLEEKGKAGKVYSIAEKNASLESLLLKPDEPMPQLLYRVEVKPDAPIVVRIPIRVDLSQ